MQELLQFIQTTGFLNIELGSLVMMLAGMLFIWASTRNLSLCFWYPSVLA